MKNRMDATCEDQSGQNQEAREAGGVRRLRQDERTLGIRLWQRRLAARAVVRALRSRGARWVAGVLRTLLEEQSGGKRVSFWGRESKGCFLKVWRHQCRIIG